MSRFFSERFRTLVAYTPGEQPKEQNLIKLNTNENPFPPVDKVRESIFQTAPKLRLYSDPDSTMLRMILAEKLGLKPENLIMTNGSDEALNFAFMAFCDERTPAVFPDITYGFYPVFAQINRLPFREIPLRNDWSIQLSDYENCGGTIFLANPNAPTGLTLSRKDIEKILRSNFDHVVVVDEAYVDFGAESSLPLLNDYENLLVVQTFSKSRSLAGLRLGFAAGNESLINDLKTIQYSTNPYNVDSLAQAAGIACLQEDDVNRLRMKTISRIRDQIRVELVRRGFETTESKANFLFVRHPAFPGSALRDLVREHGILIRWFDQPRIRDWSRISIGTEEQMKQLISVIDQLMGEII